MPVPDFSVGEVFTASAADSIGLWKITSGSLSGTSTNFTSVFSNNFRNYRIVVSGIQSSAAADLYVRLLDGTTAQATGGNYYWAYRGYTQAGGAGDSAGAGQNQGFTGWTQTGVNNSTIGALSFDIYEPFIVGRTYMTVNSTYFDGNFSARNGMIEHNVQDDYNGIQFLTNSAATMGGTVAIYGYRN